MLCHFMNAVRREKKINKIAKKICMHPYKDQKKRKKRNWSNSLQCAFI